MQLRVILPTLSVMAACRRYTTATFKLAAILDWVELETSSSCYNKFSD